MNANAAQSGKKSTKKLSYNDQRDLDTIEARIQVAEQKLEDANALSSDPAIAMNSLKLQEAFKEAQKAQQEVNKLYARWEELDAMVKAL